MTMVTDDLIRKEFIHKTISWGLRKIYSIQADVISQNFSTISGQLSSWAKRGEFDFYESEVGNTYYIPLFPYLRYLDIQYSKNKGNHAMNLRRKLSVYNRVVWGVLYGETSPAIRYGMRKQVQDYIRTQLEQGLAVDGNQVALLDDF